MTMLRCIPGICHPAAQMLSVLAVSVGIVTGCGGGGESVPQGEVSGKITLDGQPLSTGRINFSSPSTGAAAYADLQQDGAYQLPASLPAGEYKVYVTPVGLGDTPPGDGPAPPSTLEGVPEKYQSEATTDITTTIKEGDNNLDFNLTP